MRLIILGSGGYGRVVADVAAQTGKYQEIAFLDDNSTAADVLGTCASFLEHKNQDTEFYPAFGNNELRLKWLDKLVENRCRVATIIHPTAYVSPVATIGEGTVVLPRACVNTASEVKRGCIINMGAMVDHNCVIGEGCHICLGAVVKANNNLPACTKIEAGEVVERDQWK